jgi:hypothetical protein
MPQTRATAQIVTLCKWLSFMDLEGLLSAAPEFFFAEPIPL